MSASMAEPIEVEETKADATAWLLVGPLGSGKSMAASHVLDMLTRRGEVPHHTEFSDYVRYEFEAEFGEDTDDNSLGAWAAEKRRANGRDYFADRMAGELSGPVPASTHVVVSGVRSPTTPPCFREQFENVVVVVMWAFPAVRQRRVSEDEHAFAERNEREMEEWGCKEFFLDPDQYDYVIPNNVDDEENLRSAICRIVGQEVAGDRDASMYEKAPWHQSEDERRSLMGVHSI